MLLRAGETLTERANQPGLLSRPFFLLALPATAGLLAAPWLYESLVWAGWLALALALTMGLIAAARNEPAKARLFGGWRCFFYFWLIATSALLLAFYWAPQAMAYSLDRTFYAGLAVTVPILMWDGLRIAIPLWLGPRLAPSLRWSWLGVACLAVLLESIQPGVFPWRLGYLQSEWSWTYQAADLFGTSWATLTVFAHAGLLQILLCSLLLRKGFNFLGKSQFLTTLAPVGIFVLGNALYGFAAQQSWQSWLPTRPEVRVGLLQVDPSFVESREKVQQASDAIAGEVDMVLWPESAAGNYALDLKDLTSFKSVFPRSREPDRGHLLWPTSTCPLVAGGKSFAGDVDEPSENYVSVIHVDANQQIVDRYHKRYLMPFGEYIPGGEWLPGWEELFALGEVMTIGTEANVLEPLPGMRLGTMLCYEDMVPHAAESLVDNGANVLACLIDGSSFDSATTLTQHRKLAQLRAVESRRYLLRCGATGETCVVSPTGEIVARLDPQTEGSLIAKIHPVDYRTFYNRTRGLLQWLMLGVLGGLLYTRSKIASAAN